MLKWKKVLKSISLSIVFILLTTTNVHAQSEQHKGQTGIASYYSSAFDGKKTASGEVFSSKKMTCASKQFPFGTFLLVTNLKNGETVVVRVNDFGPNIHGRALDLSRSAAKKLDMLKSGTAKVSIEIVKKKDLEIS